MELPVKRDMTEEPVEKQVTERWPEDKEPENLTAENEESADFGGKSETPERETEKSKAVKYPAGKRELWFGLGMIISGLLLANVLLYAGLNLGFAIAVILNTVCTGAYILARKDAAQESTDSSAAETNCRSAETGRNRAYALALLGLSIVIAASFARSDDGFVKFVMLCFLMVGVNLGLCLLAGKNRRSPDTVHTLKDAGYTLFSLGIGEIASAGSGVKETLWRSDSIGKKGASVLLGLGMAFPVLAVICFLLMSADAAFEGVMDKLPDISLGELGTTLLVGSIIVCVLYTRGTALNGCTASPVEEKKRKGLPHLTINTVLVMVCFVYLVYLVSQLAYFTGGFAGILPEEYTFSQYARRGFFEMALLCGINLSIIAFSLRVCRKKNPVSLSTRMFCLFIGVMTLFFVVAASAKMVLYIGSYGLTRLRLLTQIVMIFLGITTGLVCVWLFVPKLPYMKVVILTAMVMGAAISWADVDTQIARYNVNAYLDGRMDSVDVGYLKRNLGDGAIPYLVKLQREASDPQVLVEVRQALAYREAASIQDFRSWNYAEWKASKYLQDGDSAADKQIKKERRGTSEQISRINEKGCEKTAT